MDELLLTEIEKQKHELKELICGLSPEAVAYLLERINHLDQKASSPGEPARQ